MKTATAAALLSIALLSGCGYEPDMSQIETDLATGVEDREDVTVTVKCPESIDWKPGGEFHCTADGLMLVEEARITVSMENDDGEYTWVID